MIGSYLYQGSVTCEVRIIETDYWTGINSDDDVVTIPNRPSFYVLFLAPASNHQASQSFAHDTIESAVAEADTSAGTKISWKVWIDLPN